MQHRPSDAERYPARAANPAAAKRHRRTDILRAERTRDQGRIQALSHCCTHGRHFDQELPKVQDVERIARIDDRHRQHTPQVAIVLCRIVLQAIPGRIAASAKVTIRPKQSRQRSEFTTRDRRAVGLRFNSEPDVQTTQQRS